jgi:hypothetical protein
MPVMSALETSLISAYGFFLTKSRYIAGRIINPWIIDPIITVAINSPRFSIAPAMFCIVTNSLAMILHTPMGESLERLKKEIKLVVQCVEAVL